MRKESGVGTYLDINFVRFRKYLPGRVLLGRVAIELPAAPVPLHRIERVVLDVIIAD